MHMYGKYLSKEKRPKNTAHFSIYYQTSDSLSTTNTYSS